MFLVKGLGPRVHIWCRVRGSLSYEQLYKSKCQVAAPAEEFKGQHWGLGRLTGIEVKDRGLGFRDLKASVAVPGGIWAFSIDGCFKLKDLFEEPETVDGYMS